MVEVERERERQRGWGGGWFMNTVLHFSWEEWRSEWSREKECTGEREEGGGGGGGVGGDYLDSLCGYLQECGRVTGVHRETRFQVLQQFLQLHAVDMRTDHTLGQDMRTDHTLGQDMA